MSANKLRQIIIARIEAGETRSDVARSMRIATSTVYKAWADYEARGTTNNNLRTGRKVGEAREDNKDAVLARITEDPNVSVRQLSREFNIAQTTMRRLVSKDLGLKSLAKVQVQQLTPLQRDKRLNMCQIMLNKLKGEAAGKVLVFSDEKDFHLNKHLNRRNDRTIASSAKAVDPANRFQGRPKFPKKAMWFGFVGSDGKAFPGLWIKGTLDGPGYRSILMRKVIPVLNATYGPNNYIWVQGGASAHTSKVAMNYLEGKLVK